MNAAERNARDLRIHDERIQAEAQLAVEIMRQHPDVTWANALRAAADIIARDTKI